METIFTEYNVRELKRLLKDFYLLTGIKICVYDGEGREVCYYPERFTEFCRCLREDGAMNARCRESDRSALARCLCTGQTQIYTCHAGLTECIAPVTVRGAIGGFIVIGQIREQNARPNEGLDDALARLYEALPVISREKIAAAVHILEACAGYEQLRRFVEEGELSLHEKLEKYVGANLTADLEVNALCSVLHVSRRELYRVARESFGCTPAEFVRERRLACAAELLRTTSLPVSVIAERCGIGDYNYFSKLFRLRYDLSPRAYRSTAGETSF